MVRDDLSSSELSTLDWDVIHEEHDDERARGRRFKMLFFKYSLAVYCTKGLVYFVLLLSAIVVSLFTYFLLAGDEEDDFEINFFQRAEEVSRAAIEHTESMHQTIASLARLYPSFEAVAAAAAGASTASFLSGFQKLPFMTLHAFEAFAKDARELSGASLVAYCPLINSTANKELWEAYAVANQAWIDEGRRYYDAEYRERSAITAPIPTEIWRQSVYGTPYSYPGPAPYSPVWQLSPPPNDTSIINMDVSSDSIVEELINETATFGMPALSRPVNVGDLFGWANIPASNDKTEEMQEKDDIPHSILLEPVFASLDSRTVVGHIVGVVSWKLFLDAIVFEGSKDLLIVVENCGDVNSTFLIGGDGDAEFVGYGDRHEKEYNGMAVKSVFWNAWEQEQHREGVAETEGKADINQECAHILYLYPTKSLEEAHESRDPYVFPSIIFSIFIFAIFVFCLYDCCVQRRQNKVVSTANKTDAIVSNLFPGSFRDKLFAKSADDKKKKRARLNRVASSKRGDSDDDDDDAGCEDLENRVPHIAELYPEVTLMIADIVGFTSWSDKRQPVHVFRLLESVFQNFDQIAKRRRIFKVETVGDSYVASAGLPTARRDHAVAMAKFARDCADQFNDTIRGLAPSMGQDTLSLAMRFGLHSGPVTAGILRGERARFQLFGDTINTCSRIESLGAPGRIHISEATAALLIQAGKDHWLVEREDTVEAKGKGVMKTFWLRRSDNSCLESNPDDELANDISTDSDGKLNSTATTNPLEVAPETAGRTTMDPTSAAMVGVDVNRLEAAPMSLEECSSTDILQSTSMLALPTITKSHEHLVAWNVDTLSDLLKRVIVRQRARGYGSTAAAGTKKRESEQVLTEMGRKIGDGHPVVEEVIDVINLPEYDDGVVHLDDDDEVHGDNDEEEHVELDEAVQAQLHQFVTVIASLYENDLSFHNFEHASAMTMAVSKLLSQLGEVDTEEDEVALDHTYFMTGDPLTHLAIVASTLIHDVGHRGIPNHLLALEDTTLAAAYGYQCIAEQNSIDLAWNTLMSDGFEDLRSCMFATLDDLRHFRQMLVNCVISTDIFDAKLGMNRARRWKEAFESSEQVPTEISPELERLDARRKATVAIEHIMQVADVAHTMQPWHVYKKWNGRLFIEMYEAYLDGRSDKDPSSGWYEGEISFFEHFIIPLATKLSTCGVLDYVSEEHFRNATSNRRRWEECGAEIVADLVEACLRKYEQQQQEQQGQAEMQQEE